MTVNKKKFIWDEFAISKEEHLTSWNMPYSHYHKDFEIYILENGLRTVTIAGEDYTTAAYDAVLFPSDVPHKSRGTGGFKGICVHFSESYLDKYLTASAKQQLMKCFKSPIIHLGEEAFRIINEYADRFKLDLSDNFIILINILNILSKCNNMYISNNVTKPDIHCSKAKQIITYVDENYVFIRSINELAKEFAVSERYIFKIFNTNYNKTPKQYINELRINNACHRLKYSPNTISSIASDCGFECYEYFIRVFKSIKKCTPSEYRRSADKK